MRQDLGKSGRLWDIIGLIVGVAAILVGLVYLFQEPVAMGNSSNRDIAFGADFYTEIYDVTNRVLNRTYYILRLLERLQQGMGFAFLFFGLLDAAFFARRLMAAPKGPAAAPAEESTAPADAGFPPQDAGPSGL